MNDPKLNAILYFKMFNNTCVLKKNCNPYFIQTKDE